VKLKSHLFSFVGTLHNASFHWNWIIFLIFLPLNRDLARNIYCVCLYIFSRHSVFVYKVMMVKLIVGVERHFQQYFSCIMATSFCGGRSRSTRREPHTMGKQLVSFITCGCESSAPFYVWGTKLALCNSKWWWIQ
jgi:hypothetical protein